MTQNKPDQPQNPQNHDTPGEDQGNNKPGGQQGNNTPGGNQGVNHPDNDPGENRPGQQQDEDRTSHDPHNPVHKPPTSAQQAKKDGRSARPGADADDLDSQDRIPYQRR